MASEELEPATIEASIDGYEVLQEQQQKFTVYNIHVIIREPVTVTTAVDQRGAPKVRVERTKSIVVPQDGLPERFKPMEMDRGRSRTTLDAVDEAQADQLSSFGTLHNESFIDPEEVDSFGSARPSSSSVAVTSSSASSSSASSSASSSPQKSGQRVGFKRKHLVIPRRYSEFLDLHQHWRKKHGDRVDPNRTWFVLPEKKWKWFRAVLPEHVLEERKEALNVYLQKLLAEPDLRHYVYHFLTVDRKLWKGLEPVVDQRCIKSATSAHLRRSSSATSTMRRGSVGSLPGSVSQHNLLSHKTNKLSKIRKKKKKKRRAQQQQQQPPRRQRGSVAAAKSMITPPPSRPIVSKLRDVADDSEEDDDGPYDSGTMVSSVSGGSRGTAHPILEEDEDVAQIRWSDIWVMRAIANGDLEGVKLCVESGNLSATSVVGYMNKSLLDWALYLKQIDIVDYLMGKGADLTRTTVSSLVPPGAHELGIDKWKVAREEANPFSGGVLS